MNKSSRLSFLIGGVLCCLTFVGYSSNSHQTSDGGQQREELYVALGIPFSPWYESTEKREDGRLTSAEWEVNILSWSWPRSSPAWSRWRRGGGRGRKRVRRMTRA